MKEIKNEKISIIVPVYNAEKFIANCIESVLHQDYDKWELILISDGSTDESYNICEEYAKKDTRIKAINKINEGVSATRNSGIALSTGKYITFVDADDFIAENYLSLMLEKKNDDIGLVAYGIGYYNDDNVKQAPYRINKGVIEYESFRKVVVDDGTMSGFTLHSSCSILYDLSVIKENGIRFNSNVKYNEDGLFATEYFLTSKKSIYVDFSICPYFYRVNDSSATHTCDLLSDSYAFSMNQIVKSLKKYKEVEKQLELRAVTICIGKLLYLAKKGSLTYHVLRELMSDDEVRKGIKNLNFSAMNYKKKVFTLLMRLHLFYLLYLGLKMFKR